MSAFAAVAVLLSSIYLADPSRAATVAAEPVATGLNDPTAFTIAADGTIFYGERTTGEIHVLDQTTHTDSPFYTIPRTADEGLVGLALHPNYPAVPYVYAYVIRDVAGVLMDQLWRISASGGVGVSRSILLSAPAGPQHRGGRLLFGPSGKLFLVVGDGGSPATSQDPSTLGGKILRMKANGGIPQTNPISGSYVYASGIRNSIGLDFDPSTGRMWESDNGPECNDELNRIIPGANYGWGPSETCTTPPAAPRNTNQDGANPILPRAWYATPIAPTGVAFCSSCGLGSTTEGALLFGTYNTHSIRIATLDSTRRAITSDTLLYQHTAPVLSLEASPSGTIYFSDASAIYRLVLP